MQNKNPVKQGHEINILFYRVLFTGSILDSYYDLLDKKIKMEENIDDSEYAEIFSHEYGHFVDNQFNDISNSEQFVTSIKNDLKKYDSNTKDGLSNLNDLIDNLVKSDVAFDMAISDNMSALFKNDPKLMESYSKEGIAYYGHDNDYWNISGNCEAEIFANNFSMLAQGNNESCEFMKKYFPNTWEKFNEILKEM